VFEHQVDQLVVGELRVVEPERVVGTALAAQQVTRRDAHPPDQVGQFLARGRALQVVDDPRLLT
jgi:hypothetical protein